MCLDQYTYLLVIRELIFDLYSVDGCYIYISLFVFDEKNRANIILIVLVGVILGTLFSSLSKFMQIMIDPNEYLMLQNKLFASFNNINEDILFISVIMIVITLIFVLKDFKYLDVMSLGRDHAISLGVDYDRLTKNYSL